MSTTVVESRVADVAFPLESFCEAAPHLRRPFTPQAIKFKVQTTWPKDAPHSGLIVSYIDARLAVERLNLIVPHLWSDHYERTDGGLMWCHLTVDGITRSDVGEGQGKGLVSDALKRAAVKFGVGVSLYAVPKMVLRTSGGHLEAKRSNKGPTLVLTPAGETHVRDLYAAWLDTHGIHAFGEPCDHGDTDDAQGDAEVESEVPAQEVTKDAPPRSNGQLPPELAKSLADGYKATGWDQKLLAMHLTAVGAQDVSDVKAAVRSLTVPQARELLQAMSDAVDAKS